jgi:hypothetical protein
MKQLEAKLSAQFEQAQADLHELQASQRRIKDLLSYCQRHNISSPELKRAHYLMNELPRADKPVVSKKALKPGRKPPSKAALKKRAAAAGAV